MAIYVFSGLGADERAFKRIEWPAEVVFIQWKKPPKSHSLKDYVVILSPQIIPDPENIYVGLSFGGIIAQVMNVLIPAKKVITISSVAYRSQIPIFYRWLGHLKIPHLIPAQWVKKSPFLPKLFGVGSNSEQQLLARIISDTDVDFLKWAILSMLNWQQKEKPNNLVQINGTNDKIIPPKSFNADYYIEKGEHFMISTKAKEISEILKKEIESC